MASAIAPHLQEGATFTAVIEGTVSEADAFAAATGLAIPFIAQPDSELAKAWGVQKAGCFALVATDGSVEAVWPGVSRQGFRDLAARLGLTLPEEVLADIPGAATAGCPLDC
jgi:peroxiredoxin